MAKRAKRQALPRKRQVKGVKKPAPTGRARPRLRARALRAGKGTTRRATSKVRAKALRPKRKAVARPKGTSRPRSPRLDRVRRTLQDIIPTPPSSLNLNRRGSAVRTGRAEMAEALADHASLTPAITGGDVDADVGTAYFSGDGAPGGDNTTPDQDVVDNIGKALGIEYQDNEELRGSDKVADRDKHRWELDPASSEDYRERKK